MALAFASILLAACMTSPPGPPAGRYPYNEQIMYGDLVRTPALIAADQKFIDTVATHGMTRRQGANESVKLGWSYLKNGDMPTAIKRFNQAWLLDPDNYGAYWGFAAVMMDRDHDAVGAEQMFKKAMGMVADDVDLLVDYARFLLRERRFAEAIRMAETALALNSRTRDAQAVLATGHFLMRDLGRALDHARIARQRGETYGTMPILGCLLDKGVTRADDPFPPECLPNPPG